MELCSAPSECDDSSTAASSSTSRTENADGPSLFQEVDEAMNLCTLTYTLTMLRRLAREGKIQHNTEEIMQLPISLDEANMLVLEEKHNLTLSKYSENKRVFTSIVKTLSDRQFYNAHAHLRSPAESPLSRSRRSMSDSRSGSRSSSSRSSLEERPPATVNVSSTFITAFGGETASHNGLVFTVAVNVESKTVSLCLRGAETDIDWAPLNKDVYMEELKNPMKRHASQSRTVRIHNQLHHLMIRPTLKANGEEDWDAISEYQEILEEHIVPTLLENPGYRLVVCGHSLGGSLACLFAFLAAAEPDSMVPKPVTAITFGSSYVGDGSFRSAHQLLEGTRKLRHVRLSNDKDMVTLSPKVSFRWKFFDKDGHGGTPFKHVGMNLRLKEKGTPFEVSYPIVRTNFLFLRGIDELSRGWDQSLMTNMTCNPGDYITWPLHQIREYNRRVMRNKDLLEATTLDALYNDPVTVGALYSQSK